MALPHCDPITSFLSVPPNVVTSQFLVKVMTSVYYDYANSVQLKVFPNSILTFFPKPTVVVFKTCSPIL